MQLPVFCPGSSEPLAVCMKSKGMIKFSAEFMLLELVKPGTFLYNFPPSWKFAGFAVLRASFKLSESVFYDSHSGVLYHGASHR